MIKIVDNDKFRKEEKWKKKEWTDYIGFPINSIAKVFPDWKEIVGDLNQSFTI